MEGMDEFFDSAMTVYSEQVVPVVVDTWNQALALAGNEGACGPGEYCTESGTNVLALTVVSFAAIFLAEFLLDFLVVRLLAPSSVRYFCLHVAFNTWLTITVLPDTLACMRHPLDAFAHSYVDSVIVTTTGVASFHIYHMLFFTKLSLEDILHHVLNCIIAVAIGICCPFGNTVALANITMCGIPGGLDYFMLILVKLKWLPKMTEKRINRHLNLVIRWPLEFLCSYIIIVNMVAGNVRVPLWLGGNAEGTTPAPAWLLAAMSFGILLHGGNAIYYADKVIGNYHVKVEELRKLAESESTSNGKGKDKKNK